MMDLRHNGIPLSRVRLMIGAWILLVFLTSFGNSLPNWSQQSSLLSSATEEQCSRAAFVTLVSENDLSDMLVSISQHEDHFNHRYGYPWVFFSTEMLSDEFKESTSNATNATCIYEVISEENLDLPQSIDHTQPHDESYMTNADTGNAKSSLELRQIYRWNSGLFAREAKLRDYDWFWRVQPGDLFTYNVTFDVFKFMKDNGIAYAFKNTALNASGNHELSPLIESFMQDHHELVHAEADVSWLLDQSQSAAFNSINQEQKANDETASAAQTGIHQEQGPRTTDFKQEKRHNDLKLEGYENMWSLADAFSSWLSGIYETSLHPNFEIGSLAFFRSPHHVILFNYLDSTGEFYRQNIQDVPLHTLSASLFLPKQSVWNFRARKSCSARHDLLPGPTPEPEFFLRGADTDSTSSSSDDGKHSKGSGNDMSERMAELMNRWDWITREFRRQRHSPGLLSGNTVIDSRNFKLFDKRGPSEVYKEAQLLARGQKRDN